MCCLRLTKSSSSVRSGAFVILVASVGAATLAGRAHALVL